MLDVEKIIRRSSSNKFDTVVFFDKTKEAVNATVTNIPGAIGFPADFTTLVLSYDPNESAIIADAPNWATDEQDTAEVRGRYSLRLERARFVRTFPFDVINLDLTGFLLVPGDEFPGKIIRAFRQILEWQRKALLEGITPLDEFTLMYTTPIGPPNLTEQYLSLLEEVIAKNIEDNPELKDILKSRTGHHEPSALRKNDFDEFFRIAAPKLLAGCLRDGDWLIEPESGVQIFEFDRPTRVPGGTYKMLHLVMNVKRQSPPSEKRAPRTEGVGVHTAYASVARRLFGESVAYVSDRNIDRQFLQAHLDRIIARRNLYVQGVPVEN